MADGSIKASFDFLSYKIDKVNMKLENQVRYLIDMAPIRPEFIEMSIKLRNTEKYLFGDRIHYIGGLETRIEIKNEASGDTMVEADFGISGIFNTLDPVDAHIEENFAKFNLPAVLLPYLRATMTTILSTAGFGTVLFPLVNVYELAKTLDPRIIDHTLPENN
jgi:preprotein translocase subunit SecB